MNKKTPRSSHLRFKSYKNSQCYSGRNRAGVLPGELYNEKVPSQLKYDKETVEDSSEDCCHLSGAGKSSKKEEYKQDISHCNAVCIT